MKITLRQLQVFDAVSSTGSITKAAERLNMSQSAASISLSDLQIILRRPLFSYANGRRLLITDEGKRLQPIVRSLLNDVSDIEYGDELAPLKGMLVVGATSMVAELILPALCVEFMRLYPDVKVQVETESVGELFDRLTRLELETAVVEIYPQMESIGLTPWRRDELVLVVSPDHPLARRKRLRMKDLAGYSWCTREAYYEDGGKSATEASRRAAYPTLFTATGIAGMSVPSNDGHTIGKAIEALITCKDGSVSYVVVSSGGIGGVAEELRAVGRPDIDFAC